MTDSSEIAAGLAALSDEQLLGVLRVVTSQRPGLAAVYAAVIESAGHSVDQPIQGEPAADIEAETAVTTTTVDSLPHDQPVLDAELPQVGGGSPVPPVPVPATGTGTQADLGGYSPGGVPTFESVRDKVEQRFGTAQGMGELDRQTPAGRSADEQWEARGKAARERLEQIRKSLHGNDVDKQEP